jgi:hypothetical protein
MSGQEDGRLRGEYSDDVLLICSQALLNKVFPGAYRLRPPPGQVFVIRPSVLPRGTGIQLAGSLHRIPGSGDVAAPMLVRAGRRCTGR